MTELNDELLVAYVDGQLAKDQSKAIERVLEEDQVAAERVEALRAANAHLETAFEAMIAGEPLPLSAAEAGLSSRSAPGSRTFGSIYADRPCSRGWALVACWAARRPVTSCMTRFPLNRSRPSR